MRTVESSKRPDVRPRTPRKTVARSEAKSVVAEDPDTDRVDREFLRSATRPDLDLSAPELTVVDLFCGCGGMTLGVWEAARRSGRNLRSLLACDISESQLAVYAANFGAESVVNADLSKLSSILQSAATPLELKLFKPLRGRSVDFLLAGPPCQGHSNLNNHTRRNDPKNELYTKVARAAEILNPTHILIENVPGVLKDHGEAVRRTIAGLEELKYATNHEVVDLTTLGVAQTRKRHVLVATKAPIDPAALRFDRLLGQYRTKARSLAWAIEDLLDAQETGLMNEVPQMAEQTRERVSYLFENDIYDLPDSERPDCHRTKAHTYQSVYGRMYWDNPAPTITSGFMTVGRGRFVHPSRQRTLTPREAARVQFFPDYFDFSALTTRKAIGEAIGNAVPPKMSMAFASALLELAKSAHHG